MAFTEFAYTPSDGLNNTTSFVTTPASETAARKQIQDVFDQVATYINDTLLAELADDTSGTSGGEYIGTVAISGVTGTTVADQLSDLKTQIDAVSAGGLSAGIINSATYFADNVVTNAKLADDAVDSDQIADGSIDTAHLSADCVTGAKIADDTIDSEHYVAGSIDAEHLATGSVTEGKVGAKAITSTKIGDDAVGTDQLGTIQEITLDTGDTIEYDTTNNQIQFKQSGCETVYLCPVIYGTDASPPAGTYPKGTIYIQYSV